MRELNGKALISNELNLKLCANVYKNFLHTRAQGLQKMCAKMYDIYYPLTHMW